MDHGLDLKSSRNYHNSYFLLSTDFSLSQENLILKKIDHFDFIGLSLKDFMKIDRHLDLAEAPNQTIGHHSSYSLK
jgi:hypothetical protein